jgi:hypothetical protein
MHGESNIKFDYHVHYSRRGKTNERISTEFLSKSTTAIIQIVDQFTDDPDYERSVKARRGGLEMISCYRELLRVRKLKNS